ncbi:MAG: DUF2231 domain-containing protein [Gemmatimonadaceae bacterium]
MPNIAALHPQVVHFVIALLFVGVALRLVALTGRWKWTGAAAITLILLGTGASVVAVQSGTDAHGPVERVPGSRAVVQEHEELGERTRNIFLAVALAELIALALAGRGQQVLRFGAAALGVVGLVVLYEASEHGGELVYNYAGGVGIRDGDERDVTRLLLAGLYHQAMLDRKGGRGADAAALLAEMSRRFPADTAVRLLAIESLLRDRHDAAATLSALDTFAVAPDDRRLALSTAMLRADALVAVGRKDSAVVVLTALATRFPDNPRITAKLDSLH